MIPGVRNANETLGISAACLFTLTRVQRVRPRTPNPETVMQSLRFSVGKYRTISLWSSAKRSLSSIPSSSQNPNPIPWFIDPAEAPPPKPTQSSTQLPQTPSKPVAHLIELAPLPSNIPPTSPLVLLHAQLKTSPHLEPGTLLIREPIPTAVGPPLPHAMPKGRRKRGRTYVGEGLSESLVGNSGIWSWIVLAQVCCPIAM